MVLLVEKLGRSIRFPSNKSDASPAYLAGFRSKISESIAVMLQKPDLESSLAGFGKCFELIHASNAAFAKLAVEIDYPMKEWSAAVADHYLSFTSHLLSLINAVSSSLSHLNQSKMSLLHALNNNSTAVHRLTIIPGRKRFKLETPIAIGEKHSSRSEIVLIEALTLSRKIGLLALGFVVSGLRGDAEPYLEIRNIAGGVGDDSLLKDVDSRFCRALDGSQGTAVAEVEEVNDLIKCGGSAEELKNRLKAVEKSIAWIEKQANDLFSHVLNARNKLLGNIRFPE